MSSGSTGTSATTHGQRRPPSGVLILTVAALVIITSSALATTNAFLFRSGYPYQSTVLALQQLLCTSFAVVAMQVMPAERKSLRISQKNYVQMLLPFSFILALKLFLQNKAVQFVSPAFYSMTASMLPVGVTFLSIVLGMSPFKWSTVVAAAFVSFGGVLIKAGQVELSALGFALTITALVLDAVRLILMQQLLQPLKLTGVGMMLLSSPQQCLMLFMNAAWVDGQDVARRLRFPSNQGGFGGEFLPLVLIICSLAVIVVLVNMIFVKMTSAIISAICTPFKDLATVIFSDLFVDKRTETPKAVIGFAIACTASLGYNIHDIYSKKEAEEASKNAKKETNTNMNTGGGGGGGGSGGARALPPKEEEASTITGV